MSLSDAVKQTHDSLSALLDEMLAESGGPLTAAERRAADRALDLRRRRPRSKQRRRRSS